MNDVTPMAVFREHERDGARLNRNGWTSGAPAAGPRRKLARFLVALAAWPALTAARIELGAARHAEPAAG